MTTPVGPWSQILIRLAMLISMLTPAHEGVASAASTDTIEPLDPMASSASSAVELESMLRIALAELDTAQQACRAASEGHELPSPYFDDLESSLSTYARTKSLALLVEDLRRARHRLPIGLPPAGSGHRRAGEGVLRPLRQHPIELRQSGLLERAFARTPDLLELTKEALAAGANVIQGHDARLVLEPFIDPESASENIDVYLIVVTNESVEIGNRLFENLGEWFIDNGSRAEGRLALAVEYC